MASRASRALKEGAASGRARAQLAPFAVRVVPYVVAPAEAALARRRGAEDEDVARLGRRRALLVTRLRGRAALLDHLALERRPIEVDLAAAAGHAHPGVRLARVAAVCGGAHLERHTP
eukprot:79267-Prymnesium_polylepis.1